MWNKTFKHNLTSTINILVFSFLFFVIADYTHHDIDYQASLNWDQNGSIVSMSFTLTFAIYVVIQIVKINHLLKSNHKKILSSYDWKYIKLLFLALIKVTPLLIIYTLFKMQTIFSSKTFNLELPKSALVLILISTVIFISIITLIFLTCLAFVIKANYKELDNINNSCFSEVLTNKFLYLKHKLKTKNLVAQNVADQSKVYFFIKTTIAEANLEINSKSTKKLNDNKKAKAPPNIFS